MKRKYLEDFWQPQGIPLVFLDTRVYLHNILMKYPDGKDPEFSFKYFYVQWAKLLNQPFHWLRGFNWQVAMIDDFKDARGKYWRFDLYPDYKGNRSADRPMKYCIAYEALCEYLKSSPVPMFRQECFEADDFAGLFARLKRQGYAKDRQMLIGTSDYDHQQLISDEHNILWANALRYKPRLRSEYEMLSVHANRGITFAEPADIINHKQQFGDAGDNIFPGAPREIIDLIDPPIKPDDAEAKAWMLREPFNTVDLDHLAEAMQWLVLNDINT